jgi:hypothetical protein
MLNTEVAEQNPDWVTKPSDVCDRFEKERQRGVKALRELFGRRLKSSADEFCEDASLADLMLLESILEAWDGFHSSRSEESVLAGAIAELFSK